MIRACAAACVVHTSSNGKTPLNHVLLSLLLLSLLGGVLQAFMRGKMKIKGNMGLAST